MINPNEQPDDAYLDITMGNEEFRMNRRNTTLFTFFGRTALHGAEINNAEFNHIFFQRAEETETGVMGAYLFNQNPVFNQLAAFMLQHDYPAVINQNEVPECDRQAWANAQVQDLNDYIPDEWLGDGDT